MPVMLVFFLSCLRHCLQCECVSFFCLCFFFRCAAVLFFCPLNDRDKIKRLCKYSCLYWSQSSHIALVGRYRLPAHTRSEHSLPTKISTVYQLLLAHDIILIITCVLFVLLHVANCLKPPYHHILRDTDQKCEAFTDKSVSKNKNKQERCPSQYRTFTSYVKQSTALTTLST